jgi:hypothetical protein
MKRDTHFNHQFVEFIPDTLKERTLYVSIAYATASHLCACGCGHEVVTPLSPTDWRLTFDGETVSLDPSIGNWSFVCRSHYYIRRNRVRWSYPMTGREVDALRAKDAQDKKGYFDNTDHQLKERHGVSQGGSPNNWLTRATNRVLKRLARLP